VSGTGQRIATLPDLSWGRFEGILAPRTAYSGQALFAFGHANSLAATDGIEACVYLFQFAHQPQKLCREWERTAVSGSDRSTEPLRQVEVPDQFRKQLESIIEGQEYPERRNSIDALLIGEDELIWARLVDTSIKFHPMLVGQFPELRPPAFRWSVFGPSGKWLADVLIPSGFSPLLIESDDLWGLVENEDGAISVGRIGLRAKLALPRN
jgi:hypothetical protein